ncbi:hypothetical protein ROZALSC1DRAFT_31621, partial [Rozella allomycis CSF55]
MDSKSITKPDTLTGYISNPSKSSGIPSGKSISKSENKLEVPSSGFSSCFSPLIPGDTKNDRLELEEIPCSLISKMLHREPKLKDERVLLQSSLNHDNQNKWLSQFPFGLNTTGKENKMNLEQTNLFKNKIFSMQIERDGNNGNMCFNIPGQKLSGNEIQDDYKHELENDYSPGEELFVSQTNLENYMDPLQHPFHSYETLSHLSKSKLIPKMNLPMVDCTQSSSVAKVVNNQNQSILSILEDSMAPLQLPSKSISKSKIGMNLPLQNDVFSENQPVLSNLEDSLAPLINPSLYSSKSNIEMNLPLTNDGSRSQPVYTSLENFVDPLQHLSHSKETPLNVFQSKLISNMNLPVVDLCRESYEANDDQSQNQSIHKHSRNSMAAFQHPYKSLSKSKIELNLPLEIDVPSQ